MWIYFLILFGIFFLLKAFFVSPKGEHDGATVVITGGSSGIGLEYAINVAKKSKAKKIVLLARNATVLKEAQLKVLNARSWAKTSVDVMVCDVSSEKECGVVARKLGDEVTIFVNCAGVSYPTELENLTLTQINTMINTNLIGSILLTREIVPIMKKNRKGTIVFVASQAAQCGLYGYTVYSASKFAVRGFAESLEMELKCHNVSVCVAYPPDTDTAAYWKENEMKPEATRKMSEGSLMKADLVGEILFKGIEQKNFSIWFNFDGFMLAQLTAGFGSPNNWMQVVYQFLLIGCFRVIAVFIRKNFDRIARKTR